MACAELSEKTDMKKEDHRNSSVLYDWWLPSEKYNKSELEEVIWTNE